MNTLHSLGVFPRDRTAAEPHKACATVKLQEQPFRVLAVLVERAGQVITGEEIRRRDWARNVCVDFDQGLNNPIKKVREARLSFHCARQRSAGATRRAAHPTPTVGIADRNVDQRQRGSARSGRVLRVARTRPRTVSSPHGVVLAVLPFEYLSGAPDQESFSDGLTTEIPAIPAIPASTT